MKKSHSITYLCKTIPLPKPELHSVWADITAPVRDRIYVFVNIPIWNLVYEVIRK